MKKFALMLLALLLCASATAEGAAQIGAFDPLVPDAPSALGAGEHHLVDIDPGIANFQMLDPRLPARRNLARAGGAIGFENPVHDRPSFRG